MMRIALLAVFIWPRRDLAIILHTHNRRITSTGTPMTSIISMTMKYGKGRNPTCIRTGMQQLSTPTHLCSMPTMYHGRELSRCSGRSHQHRTIS
jgi:hypothetical protein